MSNAQPIDFFNFCSEAKDTYMINNLVLNMKQFGGRIVEIDRVLMNLKRVIPVKQRDLSSVIPIIKK